MSYLDCVMAITQLNGVLVIIACVVSKLVHLMLEIWIPSWSVQGSGSQDGTSN